jgi:hypothetical protein
MGGTAFPTNRYVRLALLGALSLLLLQQLQKSTGIRTWPVDDFVEYWAAARLQLAGMNPYSPETLFLLQKAVGWSESTPVMMWNPPWTLALVLPFGAWDYSKARPVWLLLHLAVLVGCVAAGLRSYEVPQRTRWVAWICVLIFFPFLFVLRAGQITPMVLLGVSGFLIFEERHWYGRAAAMVVLVTIKPHLLYLFCVALFLWALDHRLWRVLWAGTFTVVAATLIPLAFNGKVLQQYIEAATSHSPLDWATPTLGGVLRMLLGTKHAWLQFVPSAVGCLWAVLHYRQHRRSWTWREQMPLLLLTSLLTASYGAWSYDQVVLLPALIAAIDKADRNASKTRQMMLVSLFLAANVIALLMNLRGVNEIWFFWMTPVWLGLYWVASTGKSPVWSQSTG